MSSPPRGALRLKIILRTIEGRSCAICLRDMPHERISQESATSQAHSIEETATCVVISAQSWAQVRRFAIEPRWRKRKSPLDLASGSVTPVPVVRSCFLCKLLKKTEEGVDACAKVSTIGPSVVATCRTLPLGQCRCSILVAMRSLPEDCRVTANAPLL